MSSLRTALTPRRPAFFEAGVDDRSALWAKPRGLAAKIAYIRNSTIARTIGVGAALDGTITGGFTSKLDIAGTHLGREAAMFVHVSMTDRGGLVQQITNSASAEILRAAATTNRKVMGMKL